MGSGPASSPLQAFGERVGQHGGGLPRPFDRARGQAVAEKLGGAFATRPMRALAEGTAGSSPFLSRLMERHAAWLSEAAEAPPEIALDTLFETAREALGGSDRQGVSSGLRQLRGRATLLIALADLGGVFDLTASTAGLTRLAEVSLSIALDHLLAEAGRRGQLPGLGAASAARRSGYVVLGMGKLGAGALNFSSDIDLICLFDQDRFDAEDYMEARQGFIRLTRGLVEILSAQTADGYVFRTDLRLRPNPSSTPVCIAMEAAERYYEAEGRTWERAAHIKARAVAGDVAAGEAYLERLRPFVWRRSLDFYAIEDVQSLLGKIGEMQAGRRRGGDPSAVPGTDIKRAPGGIREIEFFAQTRQLILGGRNPSLRARETRAALRALAAAGEVKPETAEAMVADYEAHRLLEHRLQMIEDQQTHTIPTAEEARDRLAALMGLDNREALERGVAERHARVHETVAGFFKARIAPAPAPLTATAPDRFADAGFERPAEAAARFADWRAGALTATRSERAQRLFQGLEPRLVAGLSSAASPDEALGSLERFLTGLPAGVQVFSLLAANPAWLDLLLELIAAAPRLADYLGREPQALDALLAQDFFEPMPDAAGQRAVLEASLGDAMHYEDALDLVRRFAREQGFRAGVQVLRGLAEPEEAGAAFSGVAEAALSALLPRVVEDFGYRHGPPPGQGLAVVALGKLGTREMTAGSDLDLVILYDAPLDAVSEGRRPLPAQTYYPRLTKALLAALTAPTSEGRLYEVDMRLRPSGRQGPVAVSLDAFRRYHAEAAWVWEHLALTRARVVAAAGPEGEAGSLSDTVSALLDAVLARRKGDAAVGQAAAEMRQKLAEAHRAERDAPWALKHTAGGLMEVEFAAQTGTLLCGLPRADRAALQLPRLAEAGWLSAAEAEAMGAALDLSVRLQQLERVALADATQPERFGPCLSSALARAVGMPDFERLSDLLSERQGAAAAAVEARFQRLSA